MIDAVHILVGILVKHNQFFEYQNHDSFPI